MTTFPKSETFPTCIVRSKIMGPNPLKLCEELLEGAELASGSVVLDLGSGTGITSAMLAREYGLFTYAVDLWSDPGDNMRFFEELGLNNRRICPLKADASQGLPFATGFFDAVVSIDSYNYFGRDPQYLGERLLPYVKHGAKIYLAIPGMVRDCHDALPSELLLSWTPEQLEYMHDIDWWRAMIEPTEGVEIVDMRELRCHEEAWADWLACDNEYAVGDRTSMEAGAGKLLNSIGIVLRKL
ncbi:MAG: methyltransferase domain-containing protein [Coriobacteriales bacterium]|nr:methyltransferase domain-containing protein [Coriobacteriales bacterium]